MAYPNNRWTPDEDMLLRELVLENAAPFEIAAQLGRSISSVKARAHRLGIPLGFLLR
jgi:DNA-directed RNA polymerase specialized sigma24 family protein